MSALFLLLLACDRAPADDCAGISDDGAREDCRLQAALTLADDPDALRASLAAVPDDGARDLLRVRLVVQDPARLSWLCEDVRHGPSRDWCDRVVDRPHLSEP
jgi:hypothetical protein